MADILQKISCTYCQEDINGVRVQCCVCPNFDICLQCFAAGAEIGSHKNDHSYKFVDNSPVSIFGGKGAWSGEEHLRLLNAVELYGSWDLIAERVGTRSAEECKEEYNARYLNGNLGKATWAKVSKPNLIIDLVEDKGPLSQTAISKLAPLDATPEETKLLGYKPHRDDFDWEYDHEAEELVADLHMDDQEETDIEKAMKLGIVDIYFRRLRERHRRKRIVRDYQLVAKYFFNLRRDPTQPLYPKDQQEFRDRMRPFAQFLNSGEHERLIANIERERELRRRLAELKRYRKLGLTTQEEMVHYEQHTAFQNQQIKQGKIGSNGSATRVPDAKQYLLSDGGNGEIASSSTGVKTMWPSGSDSGYDSEAGGFGEEQDEIAKLPMWIWMAQMLLTKNNVDIDDDDDGEGATEEEEGEKEQQDGGVVNGESSGVSKLLCKLEMQLCTKLKLQPLTYLALKSLMVQDNLYNPEKYQLLLEQGDKSDNTELRVMHRVAKFCNAHGWLPSLSTK